MARTKKISEDLRKRVDVAHLAEQVTKPSLKSLDSTNPQIVYKWRKFKTTVTLPRSGWPTMITPKTRRVIVHEVAKNPMVTSKQLQAFLVLANESTIRRTLNNHGVHGKVSRWKPLLSKNTIAAVCSLLKIMWTSQRANGERFNGRLRPK